MAISRYRDLTFFFIIILLLVSVNTLIAQWFYYGRNKVQYNEFEWHILKTQHFDIYYYKEMENLAEEGAFFAEESFKYLENKFNFTITRRIPLIFYSSHLHFQQTNVVPNFIPEGVGGFFEFVKGRVVIPCNGNLNQFKKVIRHELVHVFMHSKVYFANKEHSRYDQTYPPLWFTEGLAEFWSSNWDAQAEMVIKDAVLHNYIVPLSRMYTIYGTFMMYKEGQAILTYIAEKYGEEKLLLMMERIWKYTKFTEVFEEVIGKSVEEFDREWIYHLKKKYYPHLKNNDFSQMVSQTVVKKGFNFKPAYYKSEEGDKVVFVGNKTGYSNIYMTDLMPNGEKEKKDLKVLIKGERSSDFEAFHLFSSKIDVSEDGILTFSTKSGENDALYLYDIKTEDVIRKYQWPDIVGISSPSFSRDGQRVVFSGLQFNGRRDLFLVDFKDDQLIQLTNDIYEDNAPCFSPDGRKIVFSSDRTVFGDEWCYNLFIYDLDSHLMYYLTSGHYQDNTPVWSPDGNYIAFTSDRDTSLNIWVADVSEVDLWEDNSYLRIPVKRITSFANASFDPEWKDNNAILFAVYESNQFQIRYLDEIKEKYLNSPFEENNTTILSHNYWKPGNLGGDKILSKIRYEKKYQLDVAQSQVSNDPFWGTTGGAIFAFSDLLGNDQFYVLVYNNSQTRSDLLKSFNFAVTRVSLGKRTNYAYGIYRFYGQFFNFKDEFFFEERYGGVFTTSYPFSQFKRLEFSTNLSYSDKEIIAGDRRFAVLTSNFISYVQDNSIWWYTGPIDGSRFKFSIGNTYDMRYSEVNYWTFLMDYRQYFRLGQSFTYAVRLLSLINHGRETRWFYLGGSWDMRGYRRYSIRGEKIVFTSHELRFPFIDYLNLKFPFGGLGFRAIRGALFFDAGNAWNDEWEGLIGSAGFGFRLNLGGFLVLRLDIGKKTDFNKFDDGLFTQFFFGWDF
jgi:Tol biopolymer transport system component